MSTANQKPTESVSLNAFKQPKAFYLIFSIELWERFGYYGLQGIMAVYLVKQLGMSEADSITLFSSFSALVYGLVAIGGWLGDKVLGTKRVIMLGAIVLAIGYALVAWSGHDAGIVYMGMAAIAVGNGLFKANPSSLLSTSEDLQPGGINYQVCDFTPGGRFETDINRLCPPADTAVIRAA